MDSSYNSKHWILRAFWVAICVAIMAFAPVPRAVLQGAKEKQIEVQLELAQTPAEWTQGLMNRTSLPPMGGMLFIFPDDDVRLFWMKDTLIALDMVFIDRDMKIVGIIENAKPNTLTPRQVGKPSRYVLEVNGGFCRRFGVKSGKTIQLKGFEIPR